MTPTMLAYAVDGDNNTDSDSGTDNEIDAGCKGARAH